MNSKIYNKEIIWFNYEPGAGGDFLLGTLFNLPETDIAVYKEYNRYGSFYFDPGMEFPFLAISHVKTTKEVNKVRKYINESISLACISSHTPPTLIYPVLKKSEKFIYVYIYADSLTVERYVYMLSCMKNGRARIDGHPWPNDSWCRKTIHDIINGDVLSNVSVRFKYSIEYKENTFPISYCSLFIDRKPEVLKKLIDIYNAEITVEEFDLKIKEYHNKNLEIIETLNNKLRTK